MAAYAVELYSRESHLIACVPGTGSTKNPPPPTIRPSGTIVRPHAPPPKKSPYPSSSSAPPVGDLRSSSLIQNRLSMLERNPDALRRILGSGRPRLVQGSGAKAPPTSGSPKGVAPLSPADAALSRAISLHRAIPRCNLAPLLLPSIVRSVNDGSQPSARPDRPYVSVSKQPFPVLTFLVRSSHEYPLSKEVLAKRGSVSASEIFPTISSDRSLILFKPTSIVLEPFCKSRQLLAADSFTCVCFLFDSVSKRRLSEEFHLKFGTGTGTPAELRFSSGCFTVSQAAVLNPDAGLFLVIKLLNTLNRNVRTLFALY